MKICIVDKLGLCYDGDTLSKQGLGGSESAVILIAKELSKVGFNVTVVNNCIGASYSAPGTYENVRYIDNSEAHLHTDVYDAVIVSRSIYPFLENYKYPFIPTATKRILWLHDTFIEGDQSVEQMVTSGIIHHIFTLSDFHTDYVLNCEHGIRRNFEVLKKYIFQTRNGAVCHIPEVDLSKKDKNHFVYNASATKGMIPLVERIWPEIKRQIPNARLTIIGGYYRFRDNAEPDAQENTVQRFSQDPRLAELGITFTGVISQKEIAGILANAYMMVYPGAFPETFGISTLESLMYNTPLVTTKFGALEETAIDKACYHINYAVEPNSLFPNIDARDQERKFIETVLYAYNTDYLHQQKQNYCNVIKDVAGWDTIALQWKQFLYSITDNFLSITEYKKVNRINQKVSRIFGRTINMPAQKVYESYGDQRPVTVVSPFWNAEKYIQKNILSVAQQNYDNYIHILIDDASTDNSCNVAIETIKSLPVEIQHRFLLLKNDKNQGAIFNQINAISEYSIDNSIVMLLDGDDWLVNNPTLFHYYNDLYDQGYEFTYGSMWSVVDSIPLISQEYPSDVKSLRDYRNHFFNWKIPYTHLRTCLKSYFDKLDHTKFKDVSGGWMRSGADNPLFYELIEQVDPTKIYCNREIVCNYNDANPLNDYKVRGTEQNRNADLSYAKNNIPTKAYILKTSNPLSLEYATIAAESCDRIGLKWEYFEGYENADADTVWKTNTLGITSYLENMIPPAACCTASHFKIWEKIRDNKECAIILEHDAVMLQPINIPIPDNRIVALGYKLRNIADYDHVSAGIPEVVNDINSHWGAHAYAITWKTAAKLITELGTIGVPVAIDDAYFIRQDDRYVSKVPLAIMEPTPAICWIRESTIWTEAHDLNAEFVESFNQNLKKKIKTQMKKILIAIPTNKYIEPETFKAIYDLEIPQGYTTDFQFFYGYQIDQIRNLIAHWAAGYDYLFSIDSDIVVPKDALVKMVGANKDIISGLYIQRIPGMHLLEIYEDRPDGNGFQNIPFAKTQNAGVMQISGCGMGCTLINSNVIRAMSYPHFVYKSAISHADTMSEDVYFCMKARQMGFTVWADTDIHCEHRGATVFKVADYVPVSPIEQIAQQDRLPVVHSEYLKTMNILPKVIYDIGACVLHWERHAKATWPNAKIVLFDAETGVETVLNKSGHPYHIGVLTDVDYKEVKFYHDIMNPGGNSYYKENTPVFTEQHAEVRIGMTLDTIVEQNNYPLPELIKMDVQGAELDVLRGATKTLRTVTDIILEAQHEDYNLGAPKVQEVIDYMQSIGFELVGNFCITSVDGDYHFKRVR